MFRFLKQSLYLLPLIFFILFINPVIALNNSSPSNFSSIERPFVTIGPIGNHSIGDSFTIEGTTNFPATENLSVYIKSSTASKTCKNNCSVWSFDSYTIVPITPGLNGTNRWSINITTSDWTPDRYWIWVQAFTIFPCFRVNQSGNPIQHCANVKAVAGDSFEIYLSQSYLSTNFTSEQNFSGIPTPSSATQPASPISALTLTAVLGISIAAAHFKKNSR
jgi:hypothetical protein